MLNIDMLLTDRCKAMDKSGIRKIFEMAVTLKDPINLSIGQPDFDVPANIKQAANDAMQQGHNGYTQTQGIAPLQNAVADKLKNELDWDLQRDNLGYLTTSGTSGGLILTFLTLAQTGDEVIIPDPYFVIYPAGGTITNSKIVHCDTYPDFRMTADKIEPLITDRTKFILLNSPGNPSGIVLNSNELGNIVDLCKSRNILLVSDEIYDEFTYADGRENGKYPTPAAFTKDMLLLRGFSKTYGMTGWRLGYAVGPKSLIDAMAKMQQYTFVCAPSMVQWAGIKALETDMSAYVASYARKRDMVINAFNGVANLIKPAGAFYAFVEVPKHLGMTGTEFVKLAVENNVLIIPGGVFSKRDTHFRISYATADDRLQAGLDILIKLLKG